MEVLIGILKEVVPFIKDWGALIIAGISLLVAIISLFKSSKAQRLQNKVNELELKIKQNELDKIAKEKEDSVLACVEARFITVGKGKHRLKVWNSGNATAYNVSARFDGDVGIMIMDREKQPFEELEAGKSYELILITHNGSASKFRIITEWTDSSGKQHDATKFAKFVMLRKIAETTATQIPPELYAGMGSALWEQERTTLIKKECHKYDEEWRMITGCIMKPPVMMEWIPSGIILGLRMGVAEENLVVSMAKEAGIKNIYKSYINAQNKLDAYPLKL